MLLSPNESALRNLYTGASHRPAFVCTPPQIQVYEHPDYDYTTSKKPVSGWLAQVVENYSRQVKYSAALSDDSVPCARLTTGTHLYAAAFGCPVHHYPDSPPAAQPLVSTAQEADKLETPQISGSPSLYRVFELAYLVQKELGPDVFLGPPDMQTGFDTAALIWEKTDFLRAMADPEEKEAVKRLSAKCAQLFKQFLLEFRREFPHCSPCHCPEVWAPPELGPWVSNDECGAFSTPMFEEFCLPELIDLSQTFGSLGMHCCAGAEHQFRSFRKIPNLYAFNRVAASKGYGPILDPLGGPDGPVMVLGWISEDEITQLMAKARPGTRFIFNLLGEPLPAASSWLDRMRAAAARFQA
jgi:hypothetical protein